MSTLSEIQGQPRAIDFLRRSLIHGRVAHAYLFAGPEGCGKHTTALAYAAALNCESVDPDAHVDDDAPLSAIDACNTCDSCLQIADGRHPDVITLERIGAQKIIPIQSIRQNVIARLGTSPNRARIRVFLIEEAGSLKGPAANALLKTLEEPPPRTTFILGTNAPDRLLPTIRSRCQRVSFLPLSESLRRILHLEEESAAHLSDLANTLEEAIHRGGLAALLESAESCSKERSDVAPTLHLLAHNLHEKARHALREEDFRRAQRLAHEIECILDVSVAITEHNAHGQLGLEGLMIRARMPVS